MAGHSKWSQIKRKKHTTDVKKGALYSKFSKEITVAVKVGGSLEPEYNFRLRNAVERAKSSGVPNDIINRAISKSQDSQDLEEILYEGYGTAGVAILITVLTDNKKRTVPDLRFVLNKYGGNLGESGCVNWNFQHVGIINITQSNITEEYVLDLLDEYLEDIESGEFITAIVKFESLEQACKILEQNNINYEAEASYLPDNTLEITDSNQIKQLENLFSELENNEDIQNFSHNAIFNY